MVTINFEFNKFINTVRESLQGYKGLLKFEHRNILFEVCITKIEDNLFLLSITINSDCPVNLIQVPDESSEWAYICLSSNNIALKNDYFASGISVFLCNRAYRYSINTKSNALNCVILNKSFIETYDYSEVFKRIRQFKSKPFFILQPLSKYSNNNEQMKVGLVKAKSLVNHYLYDLRVNTLGLKKILQNNIAIYCETAFEKNEDLVNGLQTSLGISHSEVNKLFAEVFNQDVSKYYNNFKINKCQNFFWMMI